MQFLSFTWPVIFFFFFWTNCSLAQLTMSIDWYACSGTLRNETQFQRKKKTTLTIFTMKWMCMKLKSYFSQWFTLNLKSTRYSSHSRSFCLALFLSHCTSFQYVTPCSVNFAVLEYFVIIYFIFTNTIH